MATPNSKENIVNMALGHLKIDEIVSIDPPDEDSKAARVSAKWYDQARRTVLEDHPWGFAKKRSNVTSEATTPLFEYDYKYELPSDYVRLIRLGEFWDSPDLDYDVEDGYLLFNDPGPLRLVYVYSITNVTKFSPKFITALSYKLAEFMAYEMTGNAGMKSAMYDLYAQELSTAAGIQGQNRPTRRIQKSRLASARFNGSRRWNGSS